MKLGKRHLGRPGLGRYASLLVSAIALALAFSVPAQAEECTSSSCVQYNPSLPSPNGDKAPPHHQQTPAKASKTGKDGGTTQTGSSTEGSSGPEESGEGESSPDEAAAVGGGDDGKPQGKAGGSANSGGEKAGQPGDQSATGTQVSHASDGGSSLLVPILIAIAVLAAISVAVVMIRQRRHRGPATPASEAS